MYQSCWNGYVFSHSTRSREADFVVAGFTQVGQTHAAVATGTAEEKTLRYYLVARQDVIHSFTNCDDLTCPFMTRNNGVVVVVGWPDAPVEFHVAATNSHCTRTD